MDQQKELLVVVDMQNDFITGVLGSAAAQAIVPKVVEKINDYQQKGCMIIATMDTHTDNEYKLSEEGQRLPMHCCVSQEDISGWKIHPDVAKALEKRDAFTAHIRKNVYGSTDLAKQLGMWQPNHIEFVGLCTDVCVVSNALLARSFLPNATIVVDASCCAGVTPETHKAALQVMKCCGIQIVNEVQE